MIKIRAGLAFALLLAVSFPVSAQKYDRYGHALIMGREGWVYVDRDKRPILWPYIFDNGPDYFKEGLARFVENGKMGFHDKALHIIIPAQYDFVFPFEGGVAKAGMHCKIHQEGEHSSVSCEKWEMVRKPGG